MTKYELSITIPAGGALATNCAVAAFAQGMVLPGSSALYRVSYLPAVKIFFQMAAGGTGVGFVGNSLVNSAGLHADYQIAASPNPLTPGGSVAVESHYDANVFDLSQFWIHGSNPGDVLIVSYTQV